MKTNRSSLYEKTLKISSITIKDRAMDKITKKEFKLMHSGLSLIQGMVFKPKEEMLDILNTVEDIAPYLRPVSNYGEIGSDKTGIQKTDIYQDGPYIFVETTIDNSKDRNTSRMDKQLFNTVYYKA